MYCIRVYLNKKNLIKTDYNFYLFLIGTIKYKIYILCIYIPN